MTRIKRGLTPQEFENRYLPELWGERDLQLLIQYKMRKYKLLKAPQEVRIKTNVTTRRADLATWLTVYEVKRYLTRDNIFHAVAQTELYTYYGDKLLWIIPKRRVVVGIAPTDYSEYQAAVSVARDFRRMGIGVVFINESGLNFPLTEWRIVIIAIAIFTILLIGLIISVYLAR
ncbi:MAG: hypothetical protein HC836_50140 [Richelia sp. RM2_1_2]|nr:hypothetical protein [Richelia sp. RM2_1_2]